MEENTREADKKYMQSRANNIRVGTKFQAIIPSFNPVGISENPVQKKDTGREKDEQMEESKGPPIGGITNVTMGEEYVYNEEVKKWLLGRNNRGCRVGDEYQAQLPPTGNIGGEEVEPVFRIIRDKEEDTNKIIETTKRKREEGERVEYAPTKHFKYDQYYLPLCEYSLWNNYRAMDYLHLLCICIC